MRRVVVTGLGIVSCLGNDADSVSGALAEGRSGIRAMPDYPTLGLRSHVAGVPEIVVADHLDRRDLRFMGDAAAFAAIAMARAIEASGLTPEQSSVALLQSRKEIEALHTLLNPTPIPVLRR